MSLFEIGDGLKCVAGERCIRPAEADGDQKPPFRVSEHSLRGIHQEKANDQASSSIDEQCGVREISRKKSNGGTAEGIAQIGSGQRTYGYSDVVSHDGVSPGERS